MKHLLRWMPTAWFVSTGWAHPCLADWDAPPRFALDLDGTSTSVTVPHSPALNPQGPFTVEAWVLARDYQYPGHQWDAFAVDAIVDKRDDVGFGRGYILSLGAGYPGFGVATDENLDMAVISSELITLNRYQHIAGTWDGDSLRIFVDGQWRGSRDIPQSHVVGSGEFVIGARYSHNAYFWNGLIAEVRVSSTCRYINSFTPPHSLEAGFQTLALWKFDEGTGSNAFDASGDGHDGVIANGSWLHSIQPVFIDARETVLDLGAGALAANGRVWPVRLLSNISYQLEVVGDAAFGPGPSDRFGQLLVYAETPDARPLIPIDVGFQDVFPLAGSEDVLVGALLLDSDADENSGRLRVEFTPTNIAGIPDGAGGDAQGAEQPGRRIQVFPNPASGEMSIQFDGGATPRTTSVTVVGIDGRVVRRLRLDGDAAAWNLRDDSDKPVAAGRYVLRAAGDSWSESRSVLVLR